MEDDVRKDDDHVRNRAGAFQVEGTAGSKALREERDGQGWEAEGSPGRC